MSPNKKAAFTTLLSGASSYVEYGAGGSTVLAARLGVSKIVSVESCGPFAETMRQHFQDTGHVEVLHADVGPTGNWGDPLVPIGQQYGNKDLCDRYAVAPWRFFYQTMERAPDLVLIDGSFRTLCILTSLLNVPEGADTKFFLDDVQYVSIDSFLPFVEMLDLISDVRGGKIKQALIFQKRADMDRQACERAMEAYTYEPQ